MLFNLTNDFQRLPISTGTIQNNSSCYFLEVSNDPNAQRGLILAPLEKISFANSTLYARCSGTKSFSAIVVPFADAAASGGSGGSSDGQTVPEDMVATDDEIDSLIDDIWSGGGSSSSSGGQTVPEEMVATDEEIDALIDDIWGP